MSKGRQNKRLHLTDLSAARRLTARRQAGDERPCAILPRSTPMINLDVASSARHFEQILDLQRRYHESALSPDAQEREGFVFAEHSVPLLRACPPNSLKRSLSQTTTSSCVTACPCPCHFDTDFRPLHPCLTSSVAVPTTVGLSLASGSSWVARSAWTAPIGVADFSPDSTSKFGYQHRGPTICASPRSPFAIRCPFGLTSGWASNRYRRIQTAAKLG